MPASKINIELLTKYLEDDPEQVYSEAELSYLFMERHHEWNLPRSMTKRTFIQMLSARGHLEKLHLRSKHYDPPVLYSWKGAAKPFSVARSLQNKGAFFSHASAM